MPEWCFCSVISQTDVVHPQLWSKERGEVCDQAQTELGGSVKGSCVHTV